MRSLAIAVAGFMMMAANPPAQAQEAMTADQQAALNTAIAAGDAAGIAALAAGLTGNALASLSTQVTNTNNATLIANVVVQAQAGPAGQSIAAAIGTAV